MALADGTYCWRVQARDGADNASGYSAPFTFTVGTPTPHVLLPADGSSLAGGTYFASDAPVAATRVEFRVSGPAGPDVALGDAVLTPYGWFMLRSLVALPEGTYSLTTVSHFGARFGDQRTDDVPHGSDEAGHRGDRPRDRRHDAARYERCARCIRDRQRRRHQVEFRLTGGTVQNQLIGNATPSYYGWISIWNTATVPNGTYKLRSVAFDAAGNSQTARPAPSRSRTEPQDEP